MQVYEPLVDFDSDHSIRPGLAVAWRLVDATTWEFELRQGVASTTVRHSPPRTWSLVCAEHCRRSPSSPRVFSRSGLSRRTATTSCGSARSNRSILPEQLFMIGIMSKAWAERHGAVEVAPYTDTEIAYVEDHANGTGLFVLEAYEPGARTVLVRNTEWWGLAEEPHNIDRVVFTAIADRATRRRAARGRDRFPARSRRSPSSTGSRARPASGSSRRWSSGPSSSASIRAAWNSLLEHQGREPLR